jgi:hypothetical protein
MRKQHDLKTMVAIFIKVHCVLTLWQHYWTSTHYIQYKQVKSGFGGAKREVWLNDGSIEGKVPKSIEINLSECFNFIWNATQILHSQDAEYQLWTVCDLNFFPPW